MIAFVKYQVATYSGTVQVQCEPDDEDEVIKAKAKKILTRQAGGSLPFGYESFTIIEKR
jgi:hypothetical protein